LALALKQRGWDVHVVWHGEGSVPHATYAPFAIPPAGLRNLCRFRERRERYLRGFLRTFDVVSVQFLHSWGFTAGMMEEGRLHVRPWGSDIHPPPGGPQPPVVTLQRRRDLLQMAHGVSVTCGSFRDAVASFAGIASERINVLPLGVDLALFRPPRLPAGAPVVGFLKGFGQAYGSQHLIEAMPTILTACPAARFEMVGAGPLYNASRAQAEKLGVDEHISWIGPLAHDDVPAVMRRWQISVIPSVRESFGIAALESSAMGLPVVASAVGGLRETVIDGQTGIAVPPSHPKALAIAVIQLLNDAAQRNRMGQGGRTFVENRFDERVCMDAIDRFYRQLAQGANSPERFEEATA
jgi:glycosyltransferase involved in cell wall biosynthesis